MLIMNKSFNYYTPIREALKSYFVVWHIYVCLWVIVWHIYVCLWVIVWHIYVCLWVISRIILAIAEH